MDPALDPYTPGAGRPPQALVGREADLEALDVLVSRAAHGLPPMRPMLLVGLRGVGKTVLLNKMVSRVGQAGWLCVKIEASQGREAPKRVRQDLAGGLARASNLARARIEPSMLERVLATITSFSLSVGLSSISLGVQRDPSQASTGSLDLDLRDVVATVCQAIEGKKVALTVLVDEMQDLDDELLAALVATQHEASQQGWPFYLIGAGLPGLPARLARVKSYAERMFVVREVGTLSQAQARQVLSEPASRMRASYQDQALEHLVRVSGRYPYFLQEFGSAMWRVAPSSPFTLGDALAAEREGLARLDTMFFASRWERASPTERDYLAAMAAQGREAASTTQVAERLGKTLASLGPARANLIAKGLVYAPDRGQVAFTVPGFAHYVERRAQTGA